MKRLCCDIAHTPGISTPFQQRLHPSQNFLFKPLTQASGQKVSGLPPGMALGGETSSSAWMADQMAGTLRNWQVLVDWLDSNPLWLNPDFPLERGSMSRPVGSQF
jgi:hypothetical protein